MLGLIRQLAHLVGNHRKAPSCLAGPCRFDGRIQRQQIGLFGNAIDTSSQQLDIGCFCIQVVERSPPSFRCLLRLTQSLRHPLGSRRHAAGRLPEACNQGTRGTRISAYLAQGLFHVLDRQ